MSDGYDRFLREQDRWREMLESPLDRIIREQEKWRLFAEPPSLLLPAGELHIQDHLSGPVQALVTAMRLDGARFAHALDASTFRAVSEANSAVLHMRELDHITRYTQSLAMDHVWRAQIPSVADLTPSIVDHVSHLMRSSAFAEIRLAQVEWPRLGVPWGLNAVEVASIEQHSTEMATRYSGLVQEFSDRLTEFPPIVSTRAPIEQLRAADILVVASSQEAAPMEIAEVSSVTIATTRGLLDESLSAVQPPLLRMLQGARAAALDRSNPDRTRHVTVSLRELATQVLHSLAPDDNVREWSAKPEHFDKGRPTRRARLDYIAREVNKPGFSEFLDADFKAAVKFLDVLSGGTHRPLDEWSEDQLNVIIARAESLLYFLLALGR